jgi:hypothetical protein
MLPVMGRGAGRGWEWGVWGHAGVKGAKEHSKPWGASATPTTGRAAAALTACLACPAATETGPAWEPPLSSLQHADAEAAAAAAAQPPTRAELAQQRRLLDRGNGGGLGRLRFELLGLQPRLSRAGLAVPGAHRGGGEAGGKGQQSGPPLRERELRGCPAGHCRGLLRTPRSPASPPPPPPPRAHARPPPPTRTHNSPPQPPTHQTMPETASAMPPNFLAVMVSPRKAQPPSSTSTVLLWPSTWPGVGGGRRERVCVCVWERVGQGGEEAGTKRVEPGQPPACRGQLPAQPPCKSAAVPGPLTGRRPGTAAARSGAPLRCRGGLAAAARPPGRRPRRSGPGT